MFLWIARIFLILVSLIFIMVGTFLFTDPKSMASLGFENMSPVAMTAIRTWGGFFWGTGLIGLIAASRERWLTQGLVTLFVIGSFVVLTRIYGIAVDGMEPKQLSELRDESLGPLLAGIGLIFAWLHQRRIK